MKNDYPQSSQPELPCIGVFFNLFKSKKQLSIQNCLQKKEIEILEDPNPYYL